MTWWAMVSVSPLTNRPETMENKEEKEDKCIDPRCWPYRLWETFRTITIFLTCMAIPFVITIDSTHPSVWEFMYSLDAVFVIDIILEFLLAQPNNQGILQYNYAVIRKQYLSFWFWFDLVSVIPFELLAFIVQPTALMQVMAIFQLNRFIRLHKLLSFFGKFTFIFHL